MWGRVLHNFIRLHYFHITPQVSKYVNTDNHRYNIQSKINRRLIINWMVLFLHRIGIELRNNLEMDTIMTPISSLNRPQVYICCPTFYTGCTSLI